MSLAAALLVWGCFATAQAERTSRDRARVLFKSGKAAYAAGQYAEAARLFSEGYRLDPVPAFLLNMAQSYRGAGRDELALRHYRRYLETAPATALRSQVEELIQELEKKIQRERPPVVARPPEPPVPPPPDTPPPPPDTPPPLTTPFYQTWWFWTIVGAVVVGTGAGVGAYYGTREPDYVKQGGLGAVRW